MAVRAGDQTMTTPPSAGHTLGDFFAVLSRRWLIVVVVFLLTAGAAAAASMRVAPVYEASTTLIADKNPPVVQLNAPGQESTIFQQPVTQAPDVFTLTELVKSEAIRDAAVARLAPGLDPAEATRILRGLRVQQVRNTDLVRVSVRHRNPEVAAEVANAVTQGLIDNDLNARRRLATKAREFIGEQLEQSSGRLRARENDMTAFKDRNHDVSLSEETQLNLRKLTALEEQLTDLRMEQQAASTGVASPGRGTGSVGSQGGPDPLISSLQSQLAALEVELSGLRQQFTPVHPQVISTKAKIEETQRRLGDAIARRQNALAARERELSADIGQVQQTLLGVPSREAVLARLTRDAQEAERNYLLLSGKFQEARIAEGSIGSPIRVVDVASAPATPVGPQRHKTMALGALIGLMLGLAGAYVVEQFDETVRSPSDIEAVLGAPVLGVIPVIPAAPHRKSGAEASLMLVTLFEQGSGLAEAFRVVRTHLLGAVRDVQSVRVLFTSALPREGKSTVVANLALAVAQTDRRVWLIDGNLRHPALHQLFPQAQSRGLSGLLTGRAEIDDVVRPTVHPRLQCVVSGPAVPDPTELLDTKRMAQFIDQARDRADVIFIDTPPVLPVADAEVLGCHADGAIIVVLAEKTDRRALAQARQRLERSGVQIIGAILNQCDSRSPWAATGRP